MSNALHLTFVPLLPLNLLWGLALFGLSLVVWAHYKKANGSLWRGAALALLLLSLFNPSVESDERVPLKDTVLLAVDDSASMQLGTRSEEGQKALKELTDKLETFHDLDIETIHIQGSEETDLFHGVEKKLASLPQDRLAGIIAITDGQIHDSPTTQFHVPFHALIAGSHKEIDRRITIKTAPAYGIVGKTVALSLRIDDQPKNLSDNANLVIKHDDGSTETLTVPIGEDIPFEATIKHAGNNLFSFTTDVLPHELTARNNSAIVSINGIRDRLRVLLVSGQPHIGERTWRDFLKSDPAVDLVHFTILRSMNSRDGVSEKDLALIPFPVQELFEVKLKSFDLVIFDRFRSQSLIPNSYLSNIARYVNDGGALLLSNSTDLNIPSLVQSPLAQILPAVPTGELLTGSFVPHVTEEGKRHPVTAKLNEIMPETSWGPWFREVATESSHGNILMTGLNGKPLLVLDRQGNGRVAEFLTDQFWLWSRGYDGGGPEGELLRRTVHWLMQEPELDEAALRAHVENTATGWQISIQRQSLHDTVEHVTVVDPLEKVADVTLATEGNPGVLVGHQSVTEPGLYSIKGRDQEILLMVGSANTPEFTDMVATEEILDPTIQASNGSATWLEDHPSGPSIRRTEKGLAQHGWDWIGLEKNGQYRVVGSKAWPLVPAWIMIMLILFCILAGWQREGRR